MKKLTKKEVFLLGFTTTTAKTVAAQRAAIERAGLTGLDAAGIDKVRRESWRFRRAANKTVPTFVLARQVTNAAWQQQPPKGVKSGKVVCCATLRDAAYNRIDW